MQEVAAWLLCRVVLSPAGKIKMKENDRKIHILLINDKHESGELDSNKTQIGDQTKTRPTLRLFTGDSAVDSKNK